MAKYPKPLLVFDFGTATTLSVIDEKGTYRGGMIMPGLRLAVEALFSGTAQLPHISLEAPGKAIGTNTVDCMNAGVIYGNAAMVDGVIDRVEEELGEPVASVVATGGLSSRIIPHCRHEIKVEKDLMMWGLKIIYEKNKGR
jgi:type III pantothenate kinase